MIPQLPPIDLYFGTGLHLANTQVEAFLRAHAADYPNKRIAMMGPNRQLCTLMDNLMVWHNCSEIPLSHFLSQGDAATEMNEIVKRMDGMVQLEVFRGWSYHKLSPGETVRIQGDSGFCLTNHSDDTYFDLTAYDVNNFGEPLCYNSLVQRLGSHSGDVHQNGNLLHRVTWNAGHDAVIAFVGFLRTPLVHFVEVKQDPIMVFPDHDAKILYMCPIPLDGTVGQASAMMGISLKSVSLNDDTIYTDVHMHIRPTLIDGMETGEYYEEIHHKVAETWQRFEPYSPLLESKEERKEDPQEKPQEEAKEEAKGISLEFVDCTLRKRPPVRMANKRFFFGQGLSESVQPWDITLPLVASPLCQGGAVLATCDPTEANLKMTPEQYMQMLKHAKDVTIHLAPGSMPENAPFPEQTINALFVLHPEDLDVTSPDTIRAALDQLDVCGLRMAGPQSTILVFYQNKFYYYSGMLSEEYGAQVYLPGTCHFRPLDTGRVYLNLELHSPARVKEMFLAITYESLFEQALVHTLQFRRAVIQMQRLLHQKDFQQICSDMTSHLATLLDQGRRRLQQVLMTDDPHRHTQASEWHRVRLALRDLRQVLATSGSVRQTSRRYLDVAQEARRRAIQNNVRQAGAMEVSQLEELYDEMTAEYGFLLLKLRRVPRMDLTLKYDLDCTEYDPRLNQLDALSYVLMTGFSGRYMNRPFAAGGMSLVSGEHHPETTYVSFPIVKRYAELTSPNRQVSSHQVLNWPEESKTEDTAIWRIKTRDMIAKELGCSPGLPQVTQVLIRLLCEAIHTMLETMPDHPPQAPTTLTYILRSLLGLLLGTLASGVRPFSEAYRLCSVAPEPKPLQDELPVYVLCKAYRYALWPELTFRRTVLHHVVHTLRVEYVQKCMRPLLDDIRSVQQAEKKQHHREIQAELDFLRALWESPDKTLLDAMLMRAPSHKPHKTGTERVIRALMKGQYPFKLMDQIYEKRAVKAKVPWILPQCEAEVKAQAESKEVSDPLHTLVVTTIQESDIMVQRNLPCATNALAFMVGPQHVITCIKKVVQILAERWDQDVHTSEEQAIECLLNV